MIIEQAVAQALGFDTEKITSQVSDVVSHAKGAGNDMLSDSAAILAKGIDNITSFDIDGMAIVIMLLFSVFAIVAACSAAACTVGIINIKNGYDDRGINQVFYSQITGATAILGLMATAIAYL